MNDYIREMRKLVGHETLLTVGCGVIIEDENGRILLQRRKDTNLWGVPGGLMEFGETFLETLTREVFEEAGLCIEEPKLFGIYSGENGFGKYPNGDQVFSIQIIFRTKRYSGVLKQEGDDDECNEHKFFQRDDLPEVNTMQMIFISDWLNDAYEEVFVR